MPDEYHWVVAAACGSVLMPGITRPVCGSEQTTCNNIKPVSKEADRTKQPEQIPKSWQTAMGIKRDVPALISGGAYSLHCFRVYDRWEDVARLTPQSLGHSEWYWRMAHVLLAIILHPHPTSGSSLFSVQKTCSSVHHRWGGGKKKVLNWSAYVNKCQRRNCRRGCSVKAHG